MLDRRAFLLTSAAAGAATALPARAAATDTPSPELAALFDAFFQEGLRQRPEGATQLGLDKGANAASRDRYASASVAVSIRCLVSRKSGTDWYAPVCWLTTYGEGP